MSSETTDERAKLLDNQWLIARRCQSWDADKGGGQGLDQPS